ncbi:hypothetical protein FQA39_LY01544 [Lamprigera yunnana]|nr:hypothetical protein FQA39_LY01544 [Lamprigera yunnana]
MAKALHLSEKDVLSALTGVGSGPCDIRTEKNLFIGPRSSTSSISDEPCRINDEDTIHYITPATSCDISIASELGEEEEGICMLHEIPCLYKLFETYEKEPSESLVSSTISCIEPEIQRTLAIIKPDAVKYQDAILRAITEAGLYILHKRFVHLTPEQVSEIYSQHYGRPSFPHIVVNMSWAPVLCLCVSGINAIEKWKNMIGPSFVINSQWFLRRSMRTKFGLLDNIPDALHASENLRDSCKENRYIIPESIIEPILTVEEQVQDFCNMYVNPTLTKGLTEVIRVKPADPICYLAEWLLKNNPYQPQLPFALAVVPT